MLVSEPIVLTLGPGSFFGWKHRFRHFINHQAIYLTFE